VVRANETADRGDTVCGQARFASVLADVVLIGGEVNTVNLVLGNITVEPLNLWSQIL
jgi:hypothetical protein